uniref:Uncharacterized protein n=1 Tax=Arundo donax TaxID=35708 RepID=A0A0A9AM29_ARUDO
MHKFDFDRFNISSLVSCFLEYKKKMNIHVIARVVYAVASLRTKWRMQMR